MLEKWRSAGFSLELSLDDLALGEDFIDAIGTREEIEDRAAILERKAGTLKQGLGLAAEVTQG